MENGKFPALSAPPNASRSQSIRNAHFSLMEHQGESTSTGYDLHEVSRTSRWYNRFLRRENALPPVPTRWDRLRHSLLCPPGVNLGRACAFLLAIPLIWLTGYGLTGEEMLINGNLFHLFILFFTCLFIGKLTEIVGVPGLLGMLFGGILLGNLEKQTHWVQQPLQKSWAGKTRGLALIIILIRGGLELDPEQLKRLSCMVIRLAFLPSAVEAVAVACLSHLILGLPWTWAFMLGFAMASVTSAVVIPCILDAQEEGYGVEKGIGTLLVAASSIDDVLAISAFSIVLGVTFAQGSLVKKILMPLAEVVVGLLYGIILGIVFWFVPNHRDNFAVAEIRSIFVLTGGIVAFFGSHVIQMESAGALGVLTLAIVTSIGWRRQGYEDENPVSHIFNYLWLFFEPLLFGLIGTEIDLFQIRLTTIGYGLAIIFGGLVFRCATTFLAVSGGNLNAREKLLTAIAWIPKATMQAAISPIILDTATAMNDPNPQYVEWGKDILTIAVMSILLTAPTGGIFIQCFAPKLLEKSATAADGGVSEDPGPHALGRSPTTPTLYTTETSVTVTDDSYS